MSVNHEVKGALAKLLATENLIIEHKKVSTACFDVLNRVLVLPIWDKASATVYDLLVGHEVGHALYTPTEDWSQQYNIPKDFVNVIEDARVEKLMKRRYPGLARSFYNGYKELNDDDFFGVSGVDMESVSLIDRINLHFKIGAHACVPFSAEEKVFVDMTEQAETFEQVLEICQLIVDFVKQKQDTVLEDFAQASQEQQEVGEGESGDSQEESNNSSMNEGEDLDDGESSDETQQGRPQSKKQKVDEMVSETQNNFDNKAEKLTNKARFDDPMYVEVPVVDTKKIILDNKDLREYLNQQFRYIELDKKRHYGDVFEEADKQFVAYKKESSKEVNYLVKEFEMKKSADSYQRTAVSKTGLLDTAKLHTYKFNEDLFKKVSVIPDGKNHGLIFVLDWSASMDNYLMDTVKQLFNLLWFCKKVQIPFEVYGFTYEWNHRLIDCDYEYSDCHDISHGTIYIHRTFSLLNFLSSTSSTKDFQNDCLNLWRLAFSLSGNYGSKYHVPAGFDLSGTPLNETVIALHQIIPQFKQTHKVQKLNVVLLTDGESNNIQYNVNLSKKYPDGPDRVVQHMMHEQVLRDRKLGRIYQKFNNSHMPNWVTTTLLRNLKDNFPEMNLIGFRILAGSAASSLVRDSLGVSRYNYFNNDETGSLKVAKIMARWKKDKSVELNEGVGYDALYAISSHNLSSDTEFEVSENASAKEIGKAFRGMLKKKTVNKKILSSFATYIS
jgi:hypothetical protein